LGAFVGACRRCADHCAAPVPSPRARRALQCLRLRFTRNTQSLSGMRQRGLPWPARPLNVASLGRFQAQHPGSPIERASGPTAADNVPNSPVPSVVSIT
jgi:hypothetical protein